LQDCLSYFDLLKNHNNYDTILEFNSNILKLNLKPKSKGDNNNDNVIGY